MSKKLTLLIIATLLFINIGLVFSAQRKAPEPVGLYSATSTNVLALGMRNWDQQVTNARTKNIVTVVHFYKKNDQGSIEFAPEYETFATDMKGAFKVAAVNCDENWDVCEKEKVSKTPLVRIYPPNPIPSFDFEGELSSKGIVAAAARFVGSNVQEVNSTNHNKFVQENPSVPKVILFTDKKAVPLMYKALSLSFEKKLSFGIIRQEETELFSDYSVKGTPKIVVVKPSEKKPYVYSGEMKYQPLFDYLNVFSETFVPGGDNAGSDKPWMHETVPELNIKSHQDICFKSEGLCVIALSKGSPDPRIVTAFEGIQKNLEEQNYRFMWLNVDTNPDFASIFGVTEFPKVVVFSAGKRKKYLIHETDPTTAILRNTLSVIENGDARFTWIKDSVPSFQA